MIIALDEAKNFLRVDITDDDMMIQTLIDASSAYLTNATGTVFDSTYPLAKTVCFMLVAEWYSNRENAQQLSAGTVSVLNGLITQLAFAESISPPQVPTGLTGTPEQTYAWLRWRANIDPDVVGYNVYRGGVKINMALVTAQTPVDGVQDAFDLGFTELVVQPDGSTVSVIEFKDGAVTQGQTYPYQVSAVDTLGNESALSVAVSVTPL